MPDCSDAMLLTTEVLSNSLSGSRLEHGLHERKTQDKRGSALPLAARKRCQAASGSILRVACMHACLSSEADPAKQSCSAAHHLMKGMSSVAGLVSETVCDVYDLSRSGLPGSAPVRGIPACLQAVCSSAAGLLGPHVAYRRTEEQHRQLV